ncbi:MAG: pyruvate, water dikinase regulatory protein [Hyphomicrobiaceae bacterium]
MAGAVDKEAGYPRMSSGLPSYFHVHLVSDSTGETLTTIAKAAAVQYADIRAIEHVHPLVRSEKQLQRVLQEIESTPGIVLYTMVNRELARKIDALCKKLNVPCVPVLDQVSQVFESYLGIPGTQKVGGQHVLDAEYFGRIDALNFSLAHDDGALPDDLNDADIIILGISRTSKTPTSIYLANRGYKTANVPLVPGIALNERLMERTSAFIVCLVASAERISQIRRNRVLTLADKDLSGYVDKALIAEEIAESRKLCSRHDWPVIDVTRRSIEETAAAILQLYMEHQPAEVLEPGGDVHE